MIDLGSTKEGVAFKKFTLEYNFSPEFQAAIEEEIHTNKIDFETFRGATVWWEDQGPIHNLIKASLVYRTGQPLILRQIEIGHPTNLRQNIKKYGDRIDDWDTGIWIIGPACQATGHSGEIEVCQMIPVAAGAWNVFDVQNPQRGVGKLWRKAIPPTIK